MESLKIIGSYRTLMCNSQWVKCAICGHFYGRCHLITNCPRCGKKDFYIVPGHYNSPIPENVIMGKTLLDGRKVVPKYFLETHAFLNPHPSGGVLDTWLSSESWFRVRGWEWIEDEEFYSYSLRIRRGGELYFAKPVLSKNINILALTMQE